jgi:flavin-dependent dehydrogenase
MIKTDVAIIGGGPGGSTLGSLLKKYSPEINVLILEREKFPRDHIGESQLPPISAVLDEMGCWDKVEAADFPIKIGATFRWGSSDELWDFEFLPLGQFKDEPRPAKFKGQRLQTAFQVDRAIYDKILLDHAREFGCDVREETQVRKVNRTGDRVDSLTLDSGEEVQAKHYVDASGNAALIRRAMGVEVDEVSNLKNVAFWDYWENAEWAVKIGVGGTRIQILSLGYGWIWFIPLGPTRTSIGLVCPADYFKKSGKTPEQLYLESLALEPRVGALTKNATRTGKISATKDWSYVTEKVFGENWYLVGEAAGFADPILSAGLTLTQTGARELAYIILDIERGGHDANWLKQWYANAQTTRVRQHIRFADFWYTANGVFKDAREYTREIARDVGLELDAEEAFKWIGAGGFAWDSSGQVGLGGYDVAGVKTITQKFTGDRAEWSLNNYNVFRINLQGATASTIPAFSGGQIRAVPCYIRGNKTLNSIGLFKFLIEQLKGERTISELVNLIKGSGNFGFATNDLALHYTMQTLEIMINDGWVDARLSRGKPRIQLTTPDEGEIVHTNRDSTS